MTGGRVAKTRATEILSTLGPWTPDTAPNTSVQTRKLKLSCYRKTLIIDKPIAHYNNTKMAFEVLKAQFATPSTQLTQKRWTPGFSQAVTVTWIHRERHIFYYHEIGLGLSKCLQTVLHNGGMGIVDCVGLYNCLLLQLIESGPLVRIVFPVVFVSVWSCSDLYTPRLMTAFHLWPSEFIFMRWFPIIGPIYYLLGAEPQFSWVCTINLVQGAAAGRMMTSAVKRSISSTTGFHNHGED